VYIEELSSGVHTITGVATSIAAFIGWANQGPIDAAVLVESWSDFEAHYGGLTNYNGTPNYLGYAVNQFFSNGGTQAYIVRIAWAANMIAAPGTTPVACATAAATASGTGLSVITATVNGISGSAGLMASASTLSSIAVTPATPSIAPGISQQFTAIGTFADTSTLDLSDVATWASGTGTVASITQTGLAKAVAGGTSSMSAAFGGQTGTTTLTVPGAALKSITVLPANATLPDGLTLQLKAIGSYADGSTQDLTASSSLSWLTSNSAFVGISTGGLATAAGAGAAAITASVGGTIKGTANINVNTAVPVSIAVTPTSLSLAAGQTQQLRVIGTYPDGSTQDVTSAVTAWNPTPTGVVTIAATGIATASAAGTTSVTAVMGALTSNAVAVTVTAAVLASIQVTAPSNNTVAPGSTLQFTATGTLTDGSPQNLTSTATWASSAPSVATIDSAGLATPVGGRGNLALWASSPGAWGNSIQVSVAAQGGNSTRFSIVVSQVQPDGSSSVLESFVNLSTTTTDPQYVATILDDDSNYLTLIRPSTGAVVAPTGVPASTTAPITLSGGADGTPLVPASDGNFEIALGPDASPTSTNTFGLRLLDRPDIFNLLCVPGETDAPTIQILQAYCALRRAFYIVDCPQTATVGGLNATGPVGSTPGSLTEAVSSNSAYYFPWVEAPDPLFGNHTTLFPPCGFVAGIYASTDADRGVWKAPAGIDASLTGVSGLQFTLTDLENGNLNIQAINCLRAFKVYGDVVWGARTLQGNDQAGSQWKYIPIRRLALYIESSLYYGTQWVVFEPNDEPLWSQIRLNVGAFMQGLFLQGAFQGSSPQQAYFVKCDSENNPQSSIDQGIVNILVGFAPLYPAEFVVIQIQQISNQ
jgi:hypothetical protein